MAPQETRAQERAPGTGEPVWPIEEREVPQSDAPGERTWPTQPFPTRPPALLPTLEMAAGRPVRPDPRAPGGGPPETGMLYVKSSTSRACGGW